MVDTSGAPVVGARLHLRAGQGAAQTSTGTDGRWSAMLPDEAVGISVDEGPASFQAQDYLRPSEGVLPDVVLPVAHVLEVRVTDGGQPVDGARLDVQGPVSGRVGGVALTGTEQVDEPAASSTTRLTLLDSNGLAVQADLPAGDDRPDARRASSGTSLHADAVVALDVRGAPPSPSSVSGSRGADGLDAAVSWVPQDGGEAVTGWTVTVVSATSGRDGTARQDSRTFHVPADVASQTLSGLDPGLDYIVSVVAGGALGDSQPRSLLLRGAASTPGADLPEGPPVLLLLVASGLGLLAVRRRVLRLGRSPSGRQQPTGPCVPATSAVPTSGEACPGRRESAVRG